LHKKLEIKPKTEKEEAESPAVQKRGSDKASRYKIKILSR